MVDLERIKGSYQQILKHESYYTDQYFACKIQKEVMVAKLKQKVRELDTKYGGGLDKMPENVAGNVRVMLRNISTLESDLEVVENLLAVLQARIEYQSSLIADRQALAAIQFELDKLKF